LTNQPPVPATAPIVKPANTPNASSTAAASGASNTLKEATMNYEVDRTIQHTKLPVGNIRRLSVAVVMNNRNIIEKGKQASKPYTDAEIAQMTALVKNAMGFDPKRGDTLNLLNSAFNNDQEILPEVPFWKDPENIGLGKEALKYLLIAGTIGFLLFGVIRPGFRNVTAKAQAEAAAAEAAAKAEGIETGLDPNVPHTPEEIEAVKAENSFDTNLQLAKQLAKDDPKIIASVLKEWVNDDE
jgi:flagellar M-ring protein FliF